MVFAPLATLAVGLSFIAECAHHDLLLFYALLLIHSLLPHQLLPPERQNGRG
jgi:hypothetical protein